VAIDSFNSSLVADGWPMPPPIPPGASASAIA
jgi:hypothetical protein